MEPPTPGVASSLKVFIVPWDIGTLNRRFRGLGLRV